MQLNKYDDKLLIPQWYALELKWIETNRQQAKKSGSHYPVVMKKFDAKLSLQSWIRAVCHSGNEDNEARTPKPGKNANHFVAAILTEMHFGLIVWQEREREAAGARLIVRAEGLLLIR